MAITRLKAYAEFADFISSQPNLEDVAYYHLSEESQTTLRELLDANRDGKLSKEQAQELEEYERLEYIIQLAKVRAEEKLEREKFPPKQNKEWVFIETWVEMVLPIPNVLLLICKRANLYEIFNPYQKHKALFSSDNYEEAMYWLAEDEYICVGRRLYEDVY